MNIIQNPVYFGSLFISGAYSALIPVSFEILKQFMDDLKQNTADPAQICLVHLQIIKQKAFQQSFQVAVIIRWI